MRLEPKLILLLWVFLLWIPVLAGAQSPPPPTATYEAYGYVDDNTDALLHLSENADLIGAPPYPIPVVVSLRLNGSATPTVTFPATVPVFGVLEISLKSHLPALTNAAQPGAGWGNGLNAHSAWLNATITLPAGAPDPTDILAVNHELATVLTAPGVHRTVSGTRRLGGTYLSTTVWRPASTTRIYLVLQDVSGAANTAYLTWNNLPTFQSVNLAANGGALVELTNSLAAGSAADLEVNTSTSSPVTGTFLAIDETTGMAVAQLLLEPPAQNVLYSTPIKVNANGWGAKVAIANVSGTPANVLATVMWYNSSQQLIGSPGSTVPVPANSAVVYDLATLVTIPSPAQVALRLDEVKSAARTSGSRRFKPASS